MSYGVTPGGFVPKTLAIIQEELEGAFQAAFGEQINLLPESVFGQLVSIAAERESLIWEQMEAVFFSSYPATASGVSLDLATSLSGAVRRPATKSLSTQQVFRSSVGSTTIPAGTQVRDPDRPDYLFEVTEELETSATEQEEVQLISFHPAPTAGTWTISLGGETSAELPYNASTAAVKAAVEAFTGITTVTVTGDETAGYSVEFNTPVFPGTGGVLLEVDTSGSTPTGILPVVTVTTIGGYAVSGEAEALEVGSQYLGEIGRLSEMLGTIPNLDETYNLASVSLGRDVETDADFKARRISQIAAPATSTLPAMQAALLDIENVDEVFIAENDTDTTVGSRPAHSFECYVLALGKTDIDPITGPNSPMIQALRRSIATEIFLQKAGGIQTHGDITVQVTDTQGIVRNVQFSQPDFVDIYLDVRIQYRQGLYPVDGDGQVLSAILEYGQSRGMGQDVVVYPDIINAIGTIPGIRDIEVKIGTTPGPISDDNVEIDNGLTGGVVEVSRWTAANITITSGTTTL